MGNDRQAQGRKDPLARCGGPGDGEGSVPAAVDAPDESKTVS